MNFNDKTREQLEKELLELTRSYNLLKEKYEAEIPLLKLAEEKAARSEKIFLKAFMTSLDPVNINRLSDGMYISINEGFTKVLGYFPDEVIGKTSLELNIWADPESRNYLVKELKEKGKVENFEAIFLKKDKSRVVGLMSASLIDFDGVPHILNVTRDITSRKKNEEALTQEQFLMEVIMNNLPDHIYFKDIESRFLRISKDHARSFGLSDPSQAVGKTDFDFFTEEHARQAYEDEQKIIQTGQPLNKEEKLTWTDHADTWSSTIKLPMRDKEGNIIGTFGISKDITKSKLTEEAMRESEELYSTLFDKALDGICLADEETGLIIDCNEVMASLVDRKREEIIGQSQKFLHPPINKKEKFSPDFVLHLNDKEGSSLGTQIITSKGIIREVEIKANHILIRGRKTMQGVFRDITENKKAQEEKEKEHNLLLVLINNMPDRIYAKDTQSRFIICNNALIKRMGKSGPDDIIGKTDFDLVPHDLAAQYYANEQEIIRSGKPLINHEEFMGLISGTARWNLTSKVPLLDRQGKIIGIIGIGRDITERKQAEEEIKLKNELLQTTNAEKDKFFSILAHDLKGPLSAFLDATQILSEEIQNMTLEEIKDITVSMKESASHIYGLLINLLEWSRLKRGMMDFNPEKFNLKQLAGTGIEVLKESAHKKEIKINCSIPDNIEIYADSHMIETIIRNLVSNAIKFTPKSGEIHVSASVTPGNPVEIRVSDNGIGMSRELMSKLFLLNERTNRKGTEDEPSTGLGLLLCKEFVEKHGGTIRVESEEGKGSTFSFTVPNKV
jgi:PAS domain S-box/PAS domain S-box/PAS domain S-box/PAS domain S-box